MEESVRQGWHTGGHVPYGYRLDPHPHPNPHKAREGKRKHRLVPDAVRAPIVRMIFEDYCLNGLGLGAICEKLNRDLDRYRARPTPRGLRRRDHLDKHERTLQLAATLALDPTPETRRPPRGRSQNCVIAGAGFEPATSGL